MIVGVKHNIEVAHRLTGLPGKCQQIHGHSMLVELSLEAARVDERGIALNYHDEEMDFGRIKQAFRAYLDTEFDHHLLLNSDDPWAKVLQDVDQHNASGHLPGLRLFPADPTVENIAEWIAEWSVTIFKCSATVRVDETATNF